MRARTPRTSAEVALEAYALTQHARQHGREPERIRWKDGTWGPLDLSGGPLPPGHPLFDRPSDVRERRRRMERARRGL